MNGSNPIWRFVVAVLAIWRVVHLLAGKDGSSNPVASLLAMPGSSTAGRLIARVHCFSAWVSLPMAIWLCSGWIGLLANWRMLSGTASLLEWTRRRAQRGFPGSPAGAEIFDGEPS